VDGQENPLNLIHSVRFFEVQDYLTLSDHAYSAAMLVVSEQTWEELDDELRSALQEAALRSSTVQREAASGADDEFLQDMIDFGVDVSELDEAARQDFRERMSGAWDIYLEAVGDTGQSILDVVEDARQ
jgi:TRAP-type transport system periplasmic protein